MLEHFSFLLYFSHETGRIERFLFNSGSKELLNKPRLIIDKDLDSFGYIEHYDSEKNINISISELENYLGQEFFSDDNFVNIVETCPDILINFKLLNDGKLNSK